jgi:5-formyltetrahydrofolate cyclo-ligase
MTLCVDKHGLRLLLKARRDAIALERRELATQTLITSLLPLLSPFKTILSFLSLPQEIDTSALNTLLVEQKKLLLPKINGNCLEVYQVNDLSKDLKVNSWHLKEPDPFMCRRVELKLIDCVLVPGLGFDAQQHRIGYGKGYYDRLLGQIAQNSRVPMQTIGLGFKEQFVEEGLFCEPHDVALGRVVLL